MEIEFKVKILPKEMRQIFYANASFAAAVALSIILLGIYIKDLWPVFAIAGSPLYWRCFLDYRKMLSQHRHPDVLRLEDMALLYLKKGKKTLRVPFTSIREIQYKEGLGFSLKESARIEILDPSFRLTSVKKKNCDLFFEWFGPSVKASLDNVVHPNQTHHLQTF
jgi:hypothetical protein